MQTQFDFLKSLKPGDVITTVGVKNVEEKTLVTDRSAGKTKWARYARVAEIDCGKSTKASTDPCASVRLEGLYPDARDVFWRVAFSDNKKRPMARKATDVEHSVYMQKYIECRKELIEHHVKCNKEEAKSLRHELKALKKIADSEGIEF